MVLMISAPNCLRSATNATKYTIFGATTAKESNERPEMLANLRKWVRKTLRKFVAQAHHPTPMAARRRRGGGKAEESEGEETYEAPNTESEEDEDSAEGSEPYSDEGEGEDEDGEEAGDGEKSGQQHAQPQANVTAQEPPPTSAPTQVSHADNEGDQGDQGEEGEEEEGQEGEGPIPPPTVEEKEKDPSYVPTIGRFFMHDDRSGGSRRGGYVLIY
jgi:hypothetical protein